MKFQIFLSLLPIFFFSNIVNAADVNLIENVFGNLIEIQGDIERGDARKIVQKLKQNLNIKQSEFTPMLDIRITSKGGDFDEAMIIGDIIRKSLIPVQVEDYCYSACFVIWVSSVDRRCHGTVGIHRPYYKKDYFSNLSIEEASNRYESLQKRSRLFLENMNVSGEIIDLMFSVPSDDMHILNHEQVNMLSARTPAYDEWIKSKCTTLSKDEERDIFILRRSETNNFTQGYINYLNNKHQSSHDCIQRNTLLEYKKTLDKLQK